MHALSIALLAAAAALYALGLRNLWSKAGARRGISVYQALYVFLGWAHMVQHEALMVAATPLLALGRPLEASFFLTCCARHCRRP